MTGKPKQSEIIPPVNGINRLRAECCYGDLMPFPATARDSVSCPVVDTEPLQGHMPTPPPSPGLPDTPLPAREQMPQADGMTGQPACPAELRDTPGTKGIISWRRQGTVRKHPVS